MPSHLKLTDERPADVSEVDLVGNGFADKFAGEAADLFKVSLQVATDCKYYYWLTKAIQKRIVAIIKALPVKKRMATVRMPSEIQQSLEELVSASKHALSQQGDRFSCQLCHSSFRRTDKSFHEWVTGICFPSELYHDKPTQIFNHFHVGNQCVHHSHKLKAFRGFVYCGKCGSRKGLSSIKYLACECRPPSDFGRATLRALQDGRLPPGLGEWPIAPLYM